MMTWVQSVWPLVAHAGSGGVLIAGLLAAAYFSPAFKKEFAYAAGVVAVALFVYGVGVHDEKVKRDAADLAVAEKVDAAVDNAKHSKLKDPFDDPKN